MVGEGGAGSAWGAADRRVAAAPLLDDVAEPFWAG